MKKCKREIHMEIHRENLLFSPHANCAMIYRTAIYFAAFENMGIILIVMLIVNNLNINF